MVQMKVVAHECGENLLPAFISHMVQMKEDK